MESEANKMSSALVNLSLVCLVIGLLLDFLTVLWAFQFSIGGKYRSGNILVPAILYVIFVLNTDINFVKERMLLFLIGMVLLHFISFFILPVIFHKIFTKDKGVR